jgi:hypothetical protein
MTVRLLLAGYASGQGIVMFMTASQFLAETNEQIGKRQKKPVCRTFVVGVKKADKSPATRFCKHFTPSFSDLKFNKIRVHVVHLSRNYRVGGIAIDNYRDRSTRNLPAGG